MSAVLSIVVMNVAYFFAMVCCTSAKTLLIPSSLTLLSWGASSASETLSAEQYWRLLTCSFVHAGILHLGVNMYVLRDVGREVEEVYGRVHFCIVYLISAVGGALTSIFCNPLLVSAGASGAIFGVFGALLAVVWRRPERFPSGYLMLHGKIVLFLILYSFIFSFIDKNTDNAAHFGGFAVGFLAGVCLLPIKVDCGGQRDEGTGTLKVNTVAKYAALSALIASLIGITAFASKLFSNRPDVIAERYYRIAVELLKENKYAEALPLLNSTIEKSPSNSSAYCDRARANLELQHFETAISDCDRALKDKSVANSAYAIRAAINQKTGNYEDAVQDLSHLIELDPKDAMAYNNRAWSEEALGHLQSALADCNKSIQLKADNATAYDTRAVNYILMSEYQKAVADLDQAIRLKPKDGAFYYHRMIANKKDSAPFDADLQKFKELGYTPESWEPR